MLNYAVFLHLKNMLSAVSSLTPLLKRSSGEYAAGAEKFFAALQAFADEQRLDLSSDIAVESQKLITFDGKSVPGRSPRKQRDAFAAGCVERVQQKVKAYLDKYDKTFSDCAVVCRQIGAQMAVFAGAADGALSLDAVICEAKTNDSLKPYYAQLVGAVGLYNLRALFDNALTEAGIIK